MRDLPQQAAPLDDHAVDVAGAEQFRHPPLFAQRVLVDARDDLLGPGTVFRRHAVFQVTGDGLQAVTLVANHGEPARPTVVLAAEPEAGVEIGHIINQFVQRIALVFQRGGQGESVALREEADELAPAGRHASG